MSHVLIFECVIFVIRDARIGEATAKMESTMKEAEAEQQRMMSK